ncbi:hypothetical protein ACIP5Y_08385 [Nocardia sp. NPDC088792]|uniref:hypothetical protein n=1 Tax=Nocardia sp. NPDC088792 TaxID=3364332 RepID=UPI0038031E9D
MIASRKAAFAAVTLVLTALAAPLALAGSAQAAPVAGACSGGRISFDSSPIGLVAAPTTANFGGDLTGCQGTPAAAGTLQGNFSGTGSCLDVNGQVNGVINWSDGETSTVSGPFDVPGGAGAAKTNTVAITGGPGAGQQLTIAQGPVDGVAMTGPCLAGNARNASIPITNARIG